MSELNEKTKESKERKEWLSYQIPDYKYRTLTAYRLPFYIKRGLIRLKNIKNIEGGFTDKGPKMNLSDIVIKSLGEMLLDEGLLHICKELESRHKNTIHCKLRGDLTVSECVSHCTIPFPNSTVE